MKSNKYPKKLDESPGAISHWHDPESDSPPVNEGTGSDVIDENGKSYLDFVSSLYCVNAGHDNEAIIDAVSDQLREIPYVSSGKDNSTRDQLADKLVEVAPDPLTDVVFSISGSEANELAIQFARENQDASKILTRWRSYHGSTYGAASLTGDPSTRNAVETHAAATGAGKFLPPLSEVFDAEGEELAEKAADHVEFVIRNEGPDSVAAIVIEPVAGSSGGYPSPPGYFERLREICDEYDVLLIADEVITGFGRCGEMFGMQTEGVDPDMITFAKGVTSSYVPLGGVIVNEEIADGIRDGGTTVGQTFAGHPVACAAGLAAIAEYEDHLVENVQSLSPLLEEKLSALEANHDVISEVQGRGFLWGVVIEDPKTGEPFANSWIDDVENPVHAVSEAANENGLLVGVGRPDFQLIVCPPLCVDEDEIEEAFEILDDAFATVFE